MLVKYHKNEKKEVEIKQKNMNINAVQYFAWIFYRRLWWKWVSQLSCLITMEK